MTADLLERINRKLDRALNELEFIKNRTGTYLGRNEAVTYLADETPLFVNTDDFGCPMNFLNGGRYEEENFRTLLSYRRPGMVFLDIGANLGVFSLRVGTYMRSGHIHAFEPIPRIRDLFARSVFLNGYDDKVTIHACAVSDHEGEVSLSIPNGHAGGASIGAAGGTGQEIRVPTRQLDTLFRDPFVCHLVKLDVEGHELRALDGMRQLMKRSHDVIVMFEKLGINSGLESGMREYARDLGWEIYALDGMKLSRVDDEAFRQKGGYFVTGVPESVEAEGLDRDLIRIYPSDLNILSGTVQDDILHVVATKEKDAVICHGPYWFVPRGYYRLTLDGKADGQFHVDLCERFGYRVHEFEWHAGQTAVEFSVDRDLCKFEFVLRSTGLEARMTIKKLTLRRLG